MKTAFNSFEKPFLESQAGADLRRFSLAVNRCHPYAIKKAIEGNIKSPYYFGAVRYQKHLNDISSLLQSGRNFHSKLYDNPF